LYDSMSYRSNLYSLMEIRKTNTFSFAKCRILFLKIKITWRYSGICPEWATTPWASPLPSPAQPSQHLLLIPQAANQPSGGRRADGKAGDETRAAAERAVVTQAVARVRSAAVSSVVASLGAVASHGQAATSWDGIWGSYFDWITYGCYFIHEPGVIYVACLRTTVQIKFVCNLLAIVPLWHVG
jgi:hypothetical protein